MSLLDINQQEFHENKIKIMSETIVFFSFFLSFTF